MARRAPAAARSAAPRAFAYRPQLAALVTRPPAGRAWLHELKLDGYRIGLESTADGVRLHSRRGRDVTAEFPELARDAGALGGRDALLDGELVADVAPGASTFQALQRRGRAHTPLRYHAFDLLRLDGEDVRALPLVRRKALLGELLGDGRGGIVPVRHFDEEGAEVLRHACRLGAEGIVSKRRAAPYRDGARHPDWQKTKCVLRQELVVGGFTDPSASASGVGSLLVGYREAGALRFAGKVSTGPGWGAAFGRELRARLAPLASVRCPFDPTPSDRWLARHAHWVRPALVCEVEFGKWTEGGQLRHPSLQGFRPDADPARVERERPIDRPEAGREAAREGGRRAGRPGAAPAAPARTARAGAAGDPDPLAGVALHRPDAPVYPRAGLTKLDLARFYVEVWPWAERHLTGRPLTVVRRRAPIATPDALRTACTFVRHTPEANAFASVRVPRVRIPERHKLGEYLWIDGLPALLALLDGGAVELHAWNAPVEDVEHPDRLVLDLDPGEGVGWERVVEAAHALRAELRAAGLESWPKATGGRGLHLVVPLTGRPGWDEVFAFSRAVAEALARARPGAFTTSFSKADRPGRILVDYKRNYRTSIAVAPFSTRATPEATVAVPLAWRELRGAGPPRCTVAALPARRQRADPWFGLWDARQRLPRAPR